MHPFWIECVFFGRVNNGYALLVAYLAIDYANAEAMNPCTWEEHK